MSPTHVLKSKAASHSLSVATSGQLQIWDHNVVAGCMQVFLSKGPGSDSHPDLNLIFI